VLAQPAARRAVAVGVGRRPAGVVGVRADLFHQRVGRVGEVGDVGRPRSGHEHEVQDAVAVDVGGRRVADVGVLDGGGVADQHGRVVGGDVVGVGLGAHQVGAVRRADDELVDEVVVLGSVVRDLVAKGVHAGRRVDLLGRKRRIPRVGRARVGRARQRDGDDAVDGARVDVLAEPVEPVGPKGPADRADGVRIGGVARDGLERLLEQLALALGGLPVGGVVAGGAAGRVPVPDRAGAGRPDARVVLEPAGAGGQRDEAAVAILGPADDHLLGFVVGLVVDVDVVAVGAVFAVGAVGNVKVVVRVEHVVGPGIVGVDQVVELVGPVLDDVLEDGVALGHAGLLLEERVVVGHEEGEAHPEGVDLVLGVVGGVAESLVGAGVGGLALLVVVPAGRGGRR
jgi:hypothetical protein